MIQPHPIARGRTRLKLLTHILFAKYGLHLPLNSPSSSTVRRPEYLSALSFLQ
jgi:hypothetical protein